MLDRFTHDMIVPGPNTIIIFQHFTFPPANLVWLVCPSVSQCVPGVEYYCWSSGGVWCVVSAGVGATHTHQH